MGLEGCGSNIARKLSLSGLGDTLLNGVEAVSFSVHSNFLANWRNSLRFELHNDPNGLLGRKHQVLAARVPATFPNPRILLKYVKPVTSWSNGGHGPNLSSWRPQQPNIEQLAAYCARYFAFGPMADIVTKFRKVVWEGVCIQMLCAVCNHNLSASYWNLIYFISHSTNSKFFIVTSTMASCSVNPLTVHQSSVS